MMTGPLKADSSVARHHSVVSHNRRQEARVENCHSCAYEFCESKVDGTVAICEGQLVMVNRSAHGILLMMSVSPRLNQLIEVHNVDLEWLWPVMVYEVRWTRQIQIETQGEMYVVGCQLTVGLSATGQISRSAWISGSV